jgi:hypothetical protein
MLQQNTWEILPSDEILSKSPQFGGEQKITFEGILLPSSPLLKIKPNTNI